jgi:hypothetical protein
LRLPRNQYQANIESIEVVGHAKSGIDNQKWLHLDRPVINGVLVWVFMSCITPARGVLPSWFVKELIKKVAFLTVALNALWTHNKAVRDNMETIPSAN